MELNTVLDKKDTEFSHLYDTEDITKYFIEKQMKTDNSTLKSALIRCCCDC